MKLDEAAITALARRYRRWAREHGLTRSDSAGDRFEGRILNRDVVFTTWLGGSTPNPPEIVVSSALDVDVPVLLPTHGREPPRSKTISLLREVLDLEGVYNLGLTSRFVRITFAPGTEPELLDGALDALEQRLRLLADPGESGLPYRS